MKQIIGDSIIVPPTYENLKIYCESLRNLSAILKVCRNECEMERKKKVKKESLAKKPILTFSRESKPAHQDKKT